MSGRKSLVVVTSVATVLAAAVVAAPAANAAKAPAQVSGARAGSVTATSAVLAWRAPASSVKNVVVRIAAGTRAPASASQGRAVATVSRSRTSVGVTRLAPGTTYTAGLFSSDGKRALSKPVAVRVQTLPAGVTGLYAQATYNTMRLAWAYAASPSTAGVVIRYAKGNSAPTSPKAGTLVPTSGKVRGATATGLALGTNYAFSVWARDAAGRVSSRSSAIFVTASTRSGGLSGVVTGSGKSLGGVEVSAYSNDEDGDGVSTTTADDGSYGLNNLKPGTYQVCFSADDATGGPSATGYVGSCVDSVVVAAGDPKAVSSALAIAYGFTGKITNADGEGLANIHVDFLGSNDEDDYLGSVHTDDNGVYERGGLPAGTTRVCAYEHDDDDASTYEYAYGCSSATITGVAGTFVTVPTFTLTKSGTLNGTLTNGSAGSGDVYLFDANGDYYNDYYLGDDQSDEFDFSDLPAGKYFVCAASGSGAYISSCSDGAGGSVFWDAGENGPSAQAGEITVESGSTTTVNFALMPD